MDNDDGWKPLLAMGGSGVPVAGLDILRLATAAVPLGGPALFAQGLGLSLLLCADGFRVREHFVSYGYGLSVATQAAIGTWLFREGLHTLAGLHAAGLVAYGLRLALFFRWRDGMESFQETKRRLNASRPGIPITFWGICGTLYAFLALPTVYVLRRLPPAQGRFFGLAPFGLSVMLVGLLLEGIADWQKTTFKKTQPDRFCDRGLYRFCRHPNYLGEVIFWSGAWVAAVPSFVSWYHWVLASVGPLQIFSIIMFATRGLEKRQAETYGSSAEFKVYTASTPVFFPGTRQFEWK